MPDVVFDAAEKGLGGAFRLGPIDLTLDPGITWIEGENGAGKSTLLRLITGDHRPDAGAVSVCGSDPLSAAGRRAVSVVPDVPAFYRDLSLDEHLRAIAQLHTVPTAPALAALAERFEIGHRMNDRPLTFSKGMKQKASILCAVARPFDVLVLDEPFSGLDIEARRVLIDLLEKERARGVCVVLTSHEEQLSSFVDRRVGIRDGVIS